MVFLIVFPSFLLTFGSTQLAQAQDAPAAEQTEQAAPAAQAAPADEAAAPVVAEEGRKYSFISIRLWPYNLQHPVNYPILKDHLS